MDMHVILSFARIATAVLAGSISILGFRAYAAKRRRDLLGMAIGTGVLASGYLAEGLLVEIVGWNVADATVLESVTTLAAAAILVASVYLPGASRTRARPRRDADASGGAPP